MGNEISYPFNTDSGGGGTQMVSQGQWQYMARMFGQDRIDHQLTAASTESTTLPFSASVVNGTTVSVAPGRAFVGGFYYQLAVTQTLTIAANASSSARTDLIVVRADLAAGAVNLAVVQGQAAPSPKTPALTRTYGGRWEMPLHQVTVPGNNGALSVVNVGPYDMPAAVSAPWNAATLGTLAAGGTFVYDMDTNSNGSQTEYFTGRDGWAATRHLGKSLSYTPSLVNTKTALPRENCTGRWRWIAPGTVSFSATLVNDWEDTGPVATGSAALGITLPVPASGAQGQVMTGLLRNPDYNGGMPNMVSLTGQTNRSSAGQTVLYLFCPDSRNPAEGLNNLQALPPRSTLYLSGVYESDTFGN